MLLKDFVTDAETGIALPPHEVPPAGYLDGAERYLFERLPELADRSTGSEELQALVHDWPTIVHTRPGVAGSDTGPAACEAFTFGVLSGRLSGVDSPSAARDAAGVSNRQPKAAAE